MLNAWLTARTLRRRADATADAARRASGNVRRHTRQAVSAGARWCAGTPGILTLFGAGVAGGLATARDDQSRDRAPTDVQSTEPEAKVTLKTTGRTSLTRDLMVNTLSRLAAAVVAARVIATAADAEASD